MTVYLLTYDLAGEDRSTDHDILQSELRRPGGHQMIGSAWLIDFEADPVALHGSFRPLLGDEDRLVVTAPCQGQFTYANAPAGTNNWLDGNRLD